MNDIIYWIWFLGLEKISTKQKNMLLEQFISPELIFSLSRKNLEKTKILDKNKLDYFEQSKILKRAQNSLHFMAANNIHLITRNDQQFPEMLKNIYMPPLALFAKGDLSLLNTPVKIGIVGSRKPTISGAKYAKLFAKSLSAVGVTIISGLATGIDGNSHWGSLSELGRTIGVLGTGIDICYPQNNQKLFDLMAQKALIITEFNLGEKPLSYHFPLRNRIISGLSKGVLVIEARKKSGSLITVNHALDQGKNVYVIPGDIGEASWAGGNHLLKEGAKLVTEPKDILEDYIVCDQLETESEEKVIQLRKKPVTVDQQLLYELINKGYRTIDELVTYSNLPVNIVNSVLTMMEIEEIIAIKYGNILLI